MLISCRLRYRRGCITERLFGNTFSIYNSHRGDSPVVFCRECKKKVDDCEHFVSPLSVPAVPVFDPKIKTLAYSPDSRTLEISVAEQLQQNRRWSIEGRGSGV